MELIRRGASTAKITLKQEEYTGQSHNVVLDMPGQVDEYIAFTAHYDSTSLSWGAYDNMSGSRGILGIAEHFAAHPTVTACASSGAAARAGTAGLKAYCADEEKLKNCVLNINLDMIGCIMGKVYLLRHRRGKSCAIIFPIWATSWASQWR